MFVCVCVSVCACACGWLLVASKGVLRKKQRLLVAFCGFNSPRLDIGDSVFVTVCLQNKSQTVCVLLCNVVVGLCASV